MDIQLRNSQKAYDHFLGDLHPAGGGLAVARGGPLPALPGGAGGDENVCHEVAATGERRSKIEAIWHSSSGHWTALTYKYKYM